MKEWNNTILFTIYMFLILLFVLYLSSKFCKEDKWFLKFGTHYVEHFVVITVPLISKSKLSDLWASDVDLFPLRFENVMFALFHEFL